jgi:hypothetical protein
MRRRLVAMKALRTMGEDMMFTALQRLINPPLPLAVLSRQADQGLPTDGEPASARSAG